MNEPLEVVVRWPIRYLARAKEVQWSKWHYSEDGGNFTTCGLPTIIGACDDCPLFPEVRDDFSLIDCKKCLGRK